MTEKIIMTKLAAEELLSKGCDELCDFTEMDEAAAAVLAAYQGAIGCPDIHTLLASQAKVLSSHSGGLSFTALEELSAEAAGYLAAAKGDLELAGPCISEIDEEVAQALVTHTDDILTLGLARMTDQTARILAGHVGPLVLPDLEEVTEAGAELLASHVGPLSINQALLADSCELHRRLVRHPSVWVAPLTIFECELAQAADGKAPESVAALADGYTYFAGGDFGYYGDVGAELLALFRMAPWEPFCIVSGIDIGEAYQDRTFYFVGTKKQVLDRIASLE